MARINIEDSIYKDSRFLKLLLEAGDEFRAIGYLVTAWSIAQKHYLDMASDRLIPFKDWPEELNILIKNKLAEKREKGVYVAGSETQFSWLIQRQDAGKKGGRSSSEARKNKRKQLESLRTNQTSSKSKQKQAKASKSNPLTLTPTPTPTPTLTPPQTQQELTSSEVSAEAKAPRKRPLSDDTLNKKTSLFIAKYCLLFKQRHNTSLRFTGKMTGVAKRIAKDFSEEKIQDLIEAYFHLPDAFLVKRKHPVEMMEAKLNELMVFSQTGKFTTNRESQQMDDMATNAILLNKIRNGEV